MKSRLTPEPTVQTPAHRWRFGPFELEPARRCLARTDGQPVSISAKAFDALVHLVHHAGQVVSRDELVEVLWPRQVVEDNNLSQTILALRRALGDTEGSPRYVATVPRRGYQFIAEVCVLAPESPPSADAGQAAAVPERHRFSSRLLAAAVIGSVAVLGMAAWLLVRSIDESAQGTAAAVGGTGSQTRDVLSRSVAVLPFANLSPNPDDAYFAAGMHEEVLNQLARIRGLTVIGRTSVMQYANPSLSIPEIASELRVSSVLEGSLRYAADRVRVSVRLVDGETGAELWSDVYEGEARDVFGIQADIATRIAAALESELSPSERTRLATVPTKSAGAYASYLKAIALYRSHGGIGVSLPTPVREAMKAQLEQAIALDPDFAAALAWRAHVNLDSLMFDSVPQELHASRAALLMASIEADARRALELDPAQGTAHTTLARLGMYRWRLDEAWATLERARELNPNDSVVLHYTAMVALLREDYPQVLAAARRAVEVDPKNPAPYSPMGIALSISGEAAAAADAFRRMIEVAPAAALGYIGLARALTGTENPERVREAVVYGEPFLENMRNFRVDAALSYAHAGAHADARRLISEFRRDVAGTHVEPGLAAMAHLALGEYESARDRIREVIATRTRGMDQMPAFLIRHNAWSDPALESAEWRALRDQLAWRP